MSISENPFVNIFPKVLEKGDFHCPVRLLMVAKKHPGEPNKQKRGVR